MKKRDARKGYGKGGMTVALAVILAFTTVLGGCGKKTSGSPEKVFLLKSITENYKGNVTRRDYEYNAQGNPVKVETYDGDGNLESVEKLKYDSKGHVIKYQAWNGSNPIPSQTYRAVYDAKGNVKKESIKSLVSSQRIVHEYDKNGIRKGIKTYKKDLSKKEYLYVYETYDDQGNQITEDLFDEDGTVSWHYEMEYDDLGNRLQKKSYMGDYLSGEEYDEFDNHGNRIRHEEIAGGKRVCAWESEYDDQGNEIKTTLYGQEGNITGVFEKKYDDYGNLIKIIDYEEDGTVAKVYENQYDEQRYLIKETVYDQNGNVKGYDDYENDSQGNILKIVGYRTDGRIETMQERKYDDNGNRTYLKHVSYDEDGKEKILLSIDQEFEESTVINPEENESKYGPTQNFYMLPEL